jgi:hypothetical protein
MEDVRSSSIAGRMHNLEEHLVSHHSSGLEAGPELHRNSKSMASKRGTSTTSAPS